MTRGEWSGVPAWDRESCLEVDGLGFVPAVEVRPSAEVPTGFLVRIDSVWRPVVRGRSTWCVEAGRGARVVRQSVSRRSDDCVQRAGGVVA